MTLSKKRDVEPQPMSLPATGAGRGNDGEEAKAPSSASFFQLVACGLVAYPVHQSMCESLFCGRGQCLCGLWRRGTGGRGTGHGGTGDGAGDGGRGTGTVVTETEQGYGGFLSFRVGNALLLPPWRPSPSGASSEKRDIFHKDGSMTRLQPRCAKAPPKLHLTSTRTLRSTGSSLLRVPNTKLRTMGDRQRHACGTVFLTT
ncbi:hypothetical protein EYF80_018787 [Liparis tanakae]|uniref:Uncharacterized protein n=1 Tax=Liparis tanakae TaxID=230148 RepID=A0A4Z2HZH3_9TELE|nr:hypothetical protein EYF80_018787 [Liparis tanakae]